MGWEARALARSPPARPSVLTAAGSRGGPRPPHVRVHRLGSGAPLAGVRACESPRPHGAGRAEAAGRAAPGGAELLILERGGGGDSPAPEPALAIGQREDSSQLLAAEGGTGWSPRRLGGGPAETSESHRRAADGSAGEDASCGGGAAGRLRTRGAPASKAPPRRGRAGNKRDGAGDPGAAERGDSIPKCSRACGGSGGQRRSGGDAGLQTPGVAGSRSRLSPRGSGGRGPRQGMVTQESHTHFQLGGEGVRQTWGIPEKDRIGSSVSPNPGEGPGTPGAGERLGGGAAGS